VRRLGEDRRAQGRGRARAREGTFWRELERRSARETDGTDTPRPKRGDGLSFGGQFVRECKATEKESMTIKRAWLEQVFRQAAQAGKEPLLVFAFKETREPGMDKEWAAIPLRLLTQLLGALKR
jgi:hypothetical protein